MFFLLAFAYSLDVLKINNYYKAYITGYIIYQDRKESLDRLFESVYIIFVLYRKFYKTFSFSCLKSFFRFRPNLVIDFYSY
jgi:hypothetical protein